MWTVDTASGADIRTLWLWDRLAVVVEVDAIAATLDALEYRHGPQHEGDDVRRRLDRVRLVVLLQVLDWLTQVSPATVH